MQSDSRSGYVALIGRPNVGKSTLLNALLGRKVSIVTPKPQTTRHRITGILNRPGAQIVFIDTPGLQRRERKAINRAMHRAAIGALEEADLVGLVIEALRWQEDDDQVLELAARPGRPMIAIVNKVDRVKPRELLLPYLQQTAQRARFEEIVPVSATRGINLDVLAGAIAARLPPAPPLFPPEAVTDRGAEFQAAEILREKLMLRLRDEVPYGIAVGIERYEEQQGRLLIVAVIWIERASQKPIVIGRGGCGLTEAGRAARLELAERTGQPVHLELRVKLRRDWPDDERALRELGYQPE